MPSNLMFQILTILKEEKDGISSWHIAKKLDSFQQNVNYHLTYLVDEGIIKKEGSKFFLIRETFVRDGYAIIPMNGTLLFLGCKYYGKCKCEGVVTKSCRLLAELPDGLKKMIKFE